MIVFISLFLMFLAGVGACATPAEFFSLETSLSSSKAALWMTSVKAFGVPLSLFILKLTKNHFIKLACALWGTFMTLFSLVVLLKISGMAPSVNLYGILFLVAVLICSSSVAIFSWIQLSAILKEVLERSKKLRKTNSANPSSDVEGAYQAPTNPS